MVSPGRESGLDPLLRAFKGGDFRGGISFPDMSFQGCGLHDWLAPRQGVISQCSWS